MAQPNFIFILIDDMGWTDLGCYGSSFYETPNLDRLAQQGMRFTDAYAACPVCSPTRASVMTGKCPARVQITNFIAGANRGKLLSTPYLHHLPLEETSLAKALGEGGYATWHVGKWHLAEWDEGGENEKYWPLGHGFDVNVGGCGWGMPRHGYFAPWKIPALKDGRDGEYLTDHLTDHAVRLIRNRAKDKPFFLNLWYYSVHIPIQAKPEYIEKYRAKAESLGLDRVAPFQVGELMPFENNDRRRVIRRTIQSDVVYAAMVQELDENIGRVLDALEDEGIADNTVVLFTSDNGGVSTSEGSPTCNAPLSQGKGWMYEGGTREPLIVRWPGVTGRDSICRTPVTSTDFYPTMLEAAGLPLRPQQHRDGVSILPLLQGGRKLDREAIFWHYPHYSNQGGSPGCSVRSGDYKLIEFFEDRRCELYNLRTDVGEDHDLSAECPDRVAAMRSMLHAWLKDLGAKIPEANPDYRG